MPSACRRARKGSGGCFGKQGVRDGAASTRVFVAELRGRGRGAGVHVPTALLQTQQLLSLPGAEASCAAPSAVPDAFWQKLLSPRGTRAEGHAGADEPGKDVPREGMLATQTDVQCSAEEGHVRGRLPPPILVSEVK